MAFSSVPIPTVTAAGFQMPSFTDVLVAHKADYVSIYAVDWDNSDQDLQWVSLEAQSMYDAYLVALSVYNSFSPSTAQGVGLSSVVKVNGIAREVASYSTTTVTIIGQADVVLVNQTVGDGTYVWALPSPIVIPFSGTIDVTATCTTVGAIPAPAGALNQILNPTLGLQSFSNATAATLGQPVETDAGLRTRQTVSTALPAVGIVDGMLGAILALPNVARARIYENDTNAPDANDIPGHTISAVVDGGDITAIATTIADRKLSSGTYGTTSAIVTTGAAQIPRTVYFYRPTEVPITVSVKLKALNGYTYDIEATIQAAIVAWVNALGIGDGAIGSIDVGRLYGPALLIGTPFASTFTLFVDGITISRDGGAPLTAPVPINFNEAPFTSTSLVSVIPS